MPAALRFRALRAFAGLETELATVEVDLRGKSRQVSREDSGFKRLLPTCGVPHLLAGNTHLHLEKAQQGAEPTAI